MKLLHFLPALLLALPLAAHAQTKPATQQVTEVTEELDPNTGKVIKRTTRTYAEPVGTATGTTSSATKVVTKTAVPTGTSPTNSSPTTTTTSTTPSASDATVSDFLREKIVVSRLDAAGLISAYSQFMDNVRADRATWNTANWDTAAAVMSALNTRYEQLRTGTGCSTDDKVTTRSQQVEFQALRTARRVTDQITDKL